MSGVHNGNAVLHHQFRFFPVHNHCTGISDFQKLLCNIRIMAQLLQHEIQINVMLVRCPLYLFRIVQQRVQIDKEGIREDFSGLMPSDCFLYQLRILFRYLLEEHVFTRSMLSFRILMMVSAPARFGLIRIIRFSRVGSAFRNVPDTR